MEGGANGSFGTAPGGAFVQGCPPAARSTGYERALFRGINAAASLKPGDGVHCDSSFWFFRGINAAASSKLDQIAALVESETSNFIAALSFKPNRPDPKYGPLKGPSRLLGP